MLIYWMVILFNFKFFNFFLFFLIFFFNFFRFLFIFEFIKLSISIIKWNDNLTVDDNKFVDKF
jgi:hypothetical protein